MDIVWQPHKGPQWEFSRSSEDEVLYGGAAGGGKTDSLIMEAIRYIRHPRYHALIIRRTFTELQEIIDRTRRYYPPMGGDYKASEHRWYFPSGAKVSMGHCQHDGSEYQYQGREFQYIAFDEAGQFLPKQILYLFSRCRSSQGIKKRIRYATNPGGPAHQFLKDRFCIGEYPMGNKVFHEIVHFEIGGKKHSETITRKFIPAKLDDNPTLANNDPTYRALLTQLPPVERMRLLEGRWDSFEGQVFSELNREVHGCEPFDIPPEWTRFRSFDWGYSSPFCVQWWAVDYDRHLYLYREWYGGRKDEARQSYVGLKMTASDIARKIKEIEEQDKRIGGRVLPGPADPSIWSKRRDMKTGIVGPSVADEMSAEGVTWLRGDNNRILGKQQVHSRLSLDDHGNPGMHIFNNCEHWWRTMALLKQHPREPEDIDHVNAEDHCYDCSRYALMSRPIRPTVKKRSDIGSFQWERRRLIRAKVYAIQHGTSINSAYGMVR